MRHSLADIVKAKELIGYTPTHRINDGLKEAMDWYVGFFDHQPSIAEKPGHYLESLIEDSDV